MSEQDVITVQELSQVLQALKPFYFGPEFYAIDKNEKLIKRFEDDVNKHMDVDTVKEGTNGLIFNNNYNDDEKANYFINHHIYWSKKLFFAGTVIFIINLLVLFILFIFTS